MHSSDKGGYQDPHRDIHVEIPNSFQPETQSLAAPHWHFHRVQVFEGVLQIKRGGEEAGSNFANLSYLWRTAHETATVTAFHLIAREGLVLLCFFVTQRNKYFLVVH